MRTVAVHDIWIAVKLKLKLNLDTVWLTKADLNITPLACTLLWLHAGHIASYTLELTHSFSD